MSFRYEIRKFAQMVSMRSLFLESDRPRFKIGTSSNEGYFSEENIEVWVERRGLSYTVKDNVLPCVDETIGKRFTRKGAIKLAEERAAQVAMAISFQSGLPFVSSLMRGKNGYTDEERRKFYQLHPNFA